MMTTIYTRFWITYFTMGALLLAAPAQAVTLDDTIVAGNGAIFSNFEGVLDHPALPVTVQVDATADGMRLTIPGLNVTTPRGSSQIAVTYESVFMTNAHALSLTASFPEAWVSLSTLPGWNGRLDFVVRENGLCGGATCLFETATQTLELHATMLPEPSTWVLLLTGLLGFRSLRSRERTPRGGN